MENAVTKYRRARKALVAGAVVALAVGGAPGAIAHDPGAGVSADDLSRLPVAVANPDVPLEVIAALPAVVQQSDVVIADDFEAGTPIVYPDGRLVEGQSDRVTADEERAQCTGTVVAPATGAWSNADNCGVAVFGHVGYYRYYSFTTGAGIAAPRVCGQGRSFTVSGSPTWTGVSCGTLTGGSVHWGNVLGNPQFRAQNLSVGWPATVSWSSS
jgi:hypothetical protein